MALVAVALGAGATIACRDNEISQRAFRYAEEFSWKNQALRHFELAEQLFAPSAGSACLPGRLLPLLGSQFRYNLCP